ncbi:ATP-binding protein [Nonomuraea turkmeniaca]|uniref:ATP-binding protein n=1 Tax=Nonomuraea turkmeniaca TaxID=103838 RepID=UPI001B8784B6|nr:TniB family NTP-binding protein [Nonomuraea turkmeniaca]
MVADMRMGPELLALTPRQRSAHEEARRDYHAELPLVNTPTIRQVLTTGRLLIQLNRRQISARRGMILSGAAGTGKTTALTQLGRTHERAVRKRHPGQRHRLPVVYVTVPPAATARMLAVEFARFFGLELSSRANITDVVNAVCATAAHAGVELVLVDEIHNLNLATRTGAEVSDQLKYFAERLPATFVYAGIEVEARGLFAGVRGRQIAGRFTLIGSTPFAYGTAEQRAAWKSLVSTLEAMLRLQQHEPGTLVALDEYLYRRHLELPPQERSRPQRIPPSVSGRLRLPRHRHQPCSLASPDHSRPGTPSPPELWPRMQDWLIQVTLPV